MSGLNYLHAGHAGNMNCSDFEKRLLATFRLTPSEPVSELVLIEAKNLGEPSASGRAPFSLLFRGPRAPVLEQSIRLLHERELGKLDIFLVPIGPDEEGMVYEAVFN